MAKKTPQQPAARTELVVPTAQARSRIETRVTLGRSLLAPTGSHAGIPENEYDGDRLTLQGSDIAKIHCVCAITKDPRYPVEAEVALEGN